MITHSRSYTSRITRCVVTAVQRERGTCTVRSNDDAARVYSNVPWASPFASSAGHAIDFCPITGDQCYLLERTANDQDKSDDAPVILAWHFRDGVGSAGRFRSQLHPGDIQLMTRKGARILLDGANGDMLVQAGPACGWTFFRGTKLAELVCDRYEHINLGGSMKWGAYGTSEEGDDVTFSLAIKDEVGATHGFVRVDTSVGAEDALKIMVGDPVAGMDSVQADYVADVLGMPSMGVLVKMTRAGQLTLHAREGASLSANRTINVTSLMAVEVSAPRQVDTAREEAKVATRALSPTLDEVYVNTRDVHTLDFRVVNRATGEVLIRTADEGEHGGENNRLLHEQVLEWMFNHTHATPNGPTLGPTGAPLDIPGVVPATPAEGVAAATAESEFWSALGIALATGDLVTASGLCTARGTALANIASASAAPPPFGISSVNDIITQETKVR